MGMLRWTVRVRYNTQQVTKKVNPNNQSNTATTYLERVHLGLVGELLKSDAVDLRDLVAREHAVPEKLDFFFFSQCIKLSAV